jgi:hypothetical protein
MWSHAVCYLYTSISRKATASKLKIEGGIYDQAIKSHIHIITVIRTSAVTYFRYSEEERHGYIGCAFYRVREHSGIVAYQACIRREIIALRETRVWTAGWKRTVYTRRMQNFLCDEAPWQPVCSDVVKWTHSAVPMDFIGRKIASDGEFLWTFCSRVGQQRFGWICCFHLLPLRFRQHASSETSIIMYCTRRHGIVSPNTAANTVLNYRIP